MKEYRGRELSINLTREQSELLEQEKRRLKQRYGVVVTAADIIAGLIEQHKTRLAQMATDDPTSVEWFYRKLREDYGRENTDSGGDSSTADTKTSDDR